jgi:chemotaxis protein CheZ
MTTLYTAPISLEDAKNLVVLIEAGDNQGAFDILVSAGAQSSVELFAEVGKLTRQLHDSLNNFQLDPRIVNLANEDIPDARTRLNYVIEATEDRNLQLGEFNELVKEVGGFLKDGNDESAKLTGLLTEVLMAQGYQDLTGQVIRRVIDLVKEVEDNLVSMLTMFGSVESVNADEVIEKPNKTENEVDRVKAEGPILDADSREDVASNQDDVDDLLSSLGF